MNSINTTSETEEVSQSIKSQKLTRVAFVTGGTVGIGAAIAQALNASGYRVAVNYRDNKITAQEFSNRTKIESYAWNVANYEECMSGVAQVENVLGPIDILVNNAGITRDSMLHKMTLEQWKEVIDIDLGSCFNMCRAVINGMRERRFGRIINISSINGLTGQIGQTNYSAAKAGMIGFTKALALEVATKNITVNAIAPGYTDTSMVASVKPDVLVQILKTVPIGRLATAKEIARCVLFMASDDSSFITGETLSINGGKYLN
jgi:acetoacetyl-CoA reductase